jgi:plastocyanin
LLRASVVCRWAGASLAFAVMAGVGCKKTAPPVQREVAKPTVRSLNGLDPATLGAVSGVVKFAGTAPAPVRVDMRPDPECGDGDRFAEDYVVHDGLLANVYVYVKSGPAAAMAQGESWMGPAVLNVKGCSFVPHVVAVTAGQRIEFRNEDALMHSIRATPGVAGSAAVDITLAPKVAGQMRMFRKPELMIPVRCGRHPWMSAFINVSPTPFFAVSGADGKFELKGLPAGDYTLGFVQEKMGERTVTVTVKALATATAGITYSL